MLRPPALRRQPGAGGEAAETPRAPRQPELRRRPKAPPGSALALNGPGGGVRPELRTRGVFSPAASGILGPVQLVAR